MSLTSALRSVARWIGNKSEREQRRPILLPGVLLQGLAKRLVLHATLRGETGNVSRQERERVLRVSFVLGEVKRHSSDQPPLRIAFAEIRLHPAVVARDLIADERVRSSDHHDARHVGAQVFSHPGIGGRLKHLKRQVSLRRR